MGVLGMEKLNLLLNLEEKIEQYYIQLAKLEINGQYDSLEYNEKLKLIHDLIHKEKTILSTINYKESVVMIGELSQLYGQSDNSSLKIGFDENTYYGRTIQLLRDMSGDDVIEYATTLNYDRNKIILSFLTFMIEQDDYQDIRESLIFYKYLLPFMNYKSEFDFLINNYFTNIELEANNYRTNDFPGYQYVDRSVLVLESLLDLKDIIASTGYVKEEKRKYTLIVIKIIRVLASSILCEQENMTFIFEDLNIILHDEELEDIKNLAEELIAILERLKNKIDWAR